MTTESSLVTLAELKKRVLERADFVNSSFIDDTEDDSELVRYIQQSYRSLYNLIVMTYKDYFVGDPLEFSLATGVSSYDLPDNVFKVSAVDKDLGGGKWAQIDLFNFNERNRSSGRINRLYGQTVKYRLVGRKILFTPADACDGTFRMWYSPKPTVPTLDADTIDGYNGWDEWVVVDAAIKCKDKEESDVRVLMKEKDALTQEIITNANVPVDGDCDTVENVNRPYYDYY